MHLSFRRLLFLICVLTDFVGFLVVFAVSRGMAEHGVGSKQLGIVGGIYSLCAGLAAIGGGALTQKIGSRTVFLTGATLVLLSILPGSFTNLSSPYCLPTYYLLAVGLGMLYPPLVGFLNQDADPHADHRGVSRTLIIFCVAWNAGVMFGQLAAGRLFVLQPVYVNGPKWIYLVAVVGAVVNLVLAVIASRQVHLAAASSAPVTPPPPEVAQLSSAYKRLGWIANLGGMFGGSLVIHLMPELAVTINVPPTEHGNILATWRVVVIGSYFWMHLTTYWHFRLSTSVLSQAIGACGLLVIAGAQSGFGLFIGLALLGQLLGYNYFSGLYYSTAGSETKGRAFAAAVHESTLAAGMMVGTIMGGYVGEHNIRLPYIFSAGIMLVLIVIQGIAWRRWVRPLNAAALQSKDPPLNGVVTADEVTETAPTHV